MTDPTFPTLRTLLETAVQAVPRNHIFTRWFANGAWQHRTYAETLDRVRILAEWFGTHGLIPRKTHVALLLPNGPDWIESYLAVTSIAGAIVPIDPKLTAPELHHILSDSEATFLVTDPAHLPLVKEVAPTLPALQQLLLTAAPIDIPAPLPTTLLPSLFHDYPDDHSRRVWDDPSCIPTPEDLCGILYTSGTTGKPKGAMLTHRNFSADAIGALTLISEYVTPKDDFLVVLPLFHAFAFTANFVVALRAHARLSFLRSLRTLQADLAALHPSVLMTVPLMAEKLHNHLLETFHSTLLGRFIHRFLPRLAGRKILAALGGRLRLIIVGGAKADPTVVGDFVRMGIPLSEGYGLTECAPVVSVCPPSHIRVGSIGPVIDGIQARIHNPNNNSVGELQIRGPITFRGYWHNDEATQNIYDGDWLKTGDLARIDAQGYLTICGRAKTLIVNREGKNIYPEEVEQAIGRSPLISAVVVLAYHTHGEPGEKVGALIAPNREALARQYPATTTPEAISALLREAVKHQCQALAAYKHPRKIVISPTPLLMTSTQKVRRHAYAGTLDE